VSGSGSVPYPLFAQALESGSLQRIENIAKQMGRVRLADALRIVELMAHERDPRYERAAERWIRRLEAETDVDTEDVELAQAAFVALPVRAEAIEPVKLLVRDAAS
jgi:hypothetical protein